MAVKSALTKLGTLFLVFSIAVGAPVLISSIPLLTTMSTYPTEYYGGDLITAMQTHMLKNGGSAILTVSNLLLLPWVITRVTPLIVAIVAARLTIKHAHESATRVMDCIYALLYRMRYLLALMVGLTPTLVLWGASLTAIGTVLLLRMTWWEGCDLPLCTELTWGETKALATIWHTATTIGWWSMTLLAAVLVVKLTARWQRATLATIVTIIATSIIPILPELPALLHIGQPALVISSWPLAYAAVTDGLRGIILGSLLPCVLGIVTIGLVKRWSRESITCSYQ